MYKKIILQIVFFCFMKNLVAQVGIGTTEPQADLDVNGSMLIQNSFQIPELETVTASDEDFKLLTRVTNSVPVGEVTVLNVDSLTVAPVNVVNYNFTNISSDNLTEVDLQYNADKYIVAISNFQYIGDPINKANAGNTKSIGAFLYRTYVKNNSWHLEIRNRFLDLPRRSSLQYKVSLIIYDKSYYRHLPPIITDLNGSNSGEASSVPAIY